MSAVETEKTITIRRPDDFHVHLRQGDALKPLALITARRFGRATIMPNTKPPVRTVREAKLYRSQIIEAVGGEYPRFDPKMTLYLTDMTTCRDIEEAAESEFMIGAKLYPAGATTNSDSGVTNIFENEGFLRVLGAMESCGLPLLVHAETPDGDVFSRERDFLSDILSWIVAEHPRLKVVVEHITTWYAAEWVCAKWDKGRHIGATITAHHLLANRTDMLGDGMKPSMYCKPILKEERDRINLLTCAASDQPFLFAGTDSAPHPKTSKHTSCCAAGCFTAPYALELYAQAFDSIGEIDKLERFLSYNGAIFFGLPLNKGTVTLGKTSRGTTIEDTRWIAGRAFEPFKAGDVINWEVIEHSY